MKKAIGYILLAAIFFFGGCHSLRKKFVRKKDYEKEPPVYVEFKDYSEVPVREVYLDCAIFLRGWLQDLVEALSREGSRKRAKRAVQEAINNLEQIAALYNQEGKEKIAPLRQDLAAVQAELERRRLPSDRERHRLIKQVESIKRRFEYDFQYSDAQVWMQ